MYSVRKATVADREAISNIWRSSFTEDQDYIDTYLDLCFPYCKGYFLLTDNDGIVSCLSVIPSYISRGSETITGGYIYAVATLPEHRGNGFAAVLIEEVTRICKNSGYSYLIVKPATAELSPYYERLGFNIKLKAALTIIARNNFYLSEKTGYTVTPMTGKVLHKLRVRTLSGYYFLTIPKIVHYAVSECLNRGGVSVVLEKEGVVPSSPLYCLAYPDESDSKKIILIETNIRTSSDKELVFSYLFNHYKDATEIIFSTHRSFFSFPENIEITSALAQSFKQDCIPVLESCHFSLPLE